MTKLPRTLTSNSAEQTEQIGRSLAELVSDLPLDSGYVGVPCDLLFIADAFHCILDKRSVIINRL